MEISKEEGLTILGLTETAWDEGLGSDGDKALVRRIIFTYPDLEIPSLVKHQLKYYDEHPK